MCLTRVLKMATSAIHSRNTASQVAQYGRDSAGVYTFSPNTLKPTETPKNAPKYSLNSCIMASIVRAVPDTILRDESSARPIVNASPGTNTMTDESTTSGMLIPGSTYWLMAQARMPPTNAVTGSSIKLTRLDCCAHRVHK